MSADRSLADAIVASNTDAAAGGCPAGAGTDTIELTPDIPIGTFDGTRSDLPPVTDDVVIKGSGYSIKVNVREDAGAAQTPVPPVPPVPPAPPAPPARAGTESTPAGEVPRATLAEETAAGKTLPEAPETSVPDTSRTPPLEPARLGALEAGPTAEPPEIVEFEETLRGVTTGTLYLRSGAGKSHEALAVLPRGTEARVLSRQGYWLRVRTSEGEGWISGRYFELEDGGSAESEASRVPE